MATLTIRLPDDKHERLKEFAQSRGMRVKAEIVYRNASLLPQKSKVLFKTGSLAAIALENQGLF